MTATAKNSTCRLFVLERMDDISGVAGTGVIAEGVEFSNGLCAIHWLSQMESIEFCANIRVVEALHGHEGRTIIKWV